MNKEPVRILHWGLENSRGGIESFIMDLYRNIDKTKVQFDFLEPHNMEELIYEDEIKQMGGRVFRVLYSKRENYKEAKKCMVNFLKEHPEIVGVHVHANFLYASLLKDAKKAGISIRILHSHNSCLGVQEGPVKELRNIVERRKIKKYPTAYFSCSDLAADYMFPGKKYTWIKNGIDIDRFDYREEVREKKRKELGISDEVIIGFVGNLRMQKNPFFVIDIFKEYYIRNVNSKLLMIGSGVLEDKLKQYVRQREIEANVIFLGNRSDVDNLYQAMDAFLLPSLYEGLPVVLVEAQASGLPCFVSDKITQQIRVTENIKYISNDIEAGKWAGEIEDTLKDFKRKSGKCDILKAEFSMKQVAEEVQNYYLRNLGETE